MSLLMAPQTRPVRDHCSSASWAADAEKLTSSFPADATSIKTIIVDSNYDAKDKCTFNDVQFRKIEVKAVKDGVLNLVTPQPIGTVVCK